MKSMNTHNRGFTLAELLIVIAVIGVLVAISIPLFTSQLAKAREAACLSNRDTLYRHIMIDLISDPSITVDDDLLAKYESQDGAHCPSKGIYKIKKDEAKGTFSVACSKHTGETGESSPSDALTKTGLSTEIIDLLKNYDEIATENGYKPVSTYDSGAVGLNTRTDEFLNLLKKYNLALDADQMKTWQFDRSNSFFYWTPVDISNLPVSNKQTIPVLRYNLKTATYTVWIADVTSGDKIVNDGDYKVLSGYQKYEPSTNENSKQQTYENASKHLQNALEKYKHS
ncbi:MAG: prepilin-type N-terminal cleavage/methylation domain-containing protein [Lachnospiraceae bacterium]|nr:prepilin-type N-terminal cleavage/methylation domain-containing protein [Lachnospiraceae bacterium]